MAHLKSTSAMKLFDAAINSGETPVPFAEAVEQMERGGARVSHVKRNRKKKSRREREVGAKN